MGTASFPMDALCAYCGCTFGSHRADSTNPSQCPGHEGRMDWDKGPGTHFKPIGGLCPECGMPGAPYDHLECFERAWT